MMERDDNKDIMAYGYLGWIAVLILAGVVIGLMFGLAQSIS